MVILRNKNLNIRKTLIVALVAMLGAVPVFVNLKSEDAVEATPLSLACSKSEECRKAAEEEERAYENAANASNTATLYQMKVNELMAQVAAKQNEIAATEREVEELRMQIANTEARLKEELEALAEVLVSMHFDGDAEPITILAGSSSISDLAERAARSEVVRQQVSVATAKIRETKAGLEADKERVELLLEQQVLARNQLEASRIEQQNLVAKFQNDAAAYEEDAERARLAKIAAEEEYQRTHPEEFVIGVSYSGLNSYPWRDNCPDEQDEYYTAYNGTYIGGYVCECVSYAGWKAFEASGGRVTGAWWGHAKSWAVSAAAAGFVVDKIPSAYSIGQSGSPYDYGYGHVFWVESVNADGSINITEYNNWWSTGMLTGSYHMGDFGAQTISAAEAAKYNYIHIR